MHRSTWTGISAGLLVAALGLVACKTTGPRTGSSQPSYASSTSSSSEPSAPQASGWFCYVDLMGSFCDRALADCQDTARSLTPSSSMDPNPPPVDVSDACSTRSSAYCYPATGVDGKTWQVCSETMEDCTADAGDNEANVTGPCVETY